MISLILATIALAAAPSWTTQDTLSQVGSKLTAVCNGQGDDLAEARVNAISSCIAVASSVAGSSWKVASKSSETDRDVSSKRDVISDQRVEGLSCKVQNEYVEEVARPVKLWIKCGFALDKTKTTETDVESLMRPRTMVLELQEGCDYVSVLGPFHRHVQCSEGRMAVILMPEEHGIVIFKHGYYNKEYRWSSEATSISLKVALTKVMD